MVLKQAVEMNQAPGAQGSRAKLEDVRTSGDVLHDLQVHQMELEMQNDELRRAQQVIEESRDRYLDLYDFAPIGYLTLNRSGQIVEANLTCAELFATGRKNLLQYRFTMFISPADVDAWTRQFIKSIGQGERQSCELALLRDDGTRFHARLDCLRILQDDDAPLLRIAITDISERWMAQQHLLGLVAASMDAIVSVDEGQHIVRFNPAAERMFGVAAEVAIGAPLSRYLPEDCARIGEGQRRGDSRQANIRIEGLRGRRADGELFPLELALTSVESRGRRLDSLILREITERMRVEQALRDIQSDLNRAQAVGKIGSWRYDLASRQLRWSDEMHRLLEIPKGVPLDFATFLACVHAEDRAFVERLWAEHLEQGKPFEFEHRVLVKGTLKWVSEKTEPEFDPAGKLLGCFGTTQDITRRKLDQLALLDADQRKNEFLAILGHELRNPLAPIRNATHILTCLKSREPHVRWAQEIIERQVVQLSRLVDDLLDVSRIVGGKAKLYPDAIELADMVDQALDMARPLLEAKRHRFVLRLPDQPVCLRGDPVRLAQVLFNLLDNAVKFTPEGGRIELAADVDGDAMILSVRDNGIGIAADLLPHVFELFRQAERALDRAQGGMGIGLTMAQRLVQLHGGSIEAISGGVGQGAEFRVRLPILDHAPAATRHAATRKAGDAVACRVMVVDDDVDVSDSMTTLLALEGHDVWTADTGAAALELARRFHPQVVLLDIGLHGMDGYEVARRLRAQQETGEALCLVAVTGYGDSATREKALAAGFDAHMVKPVEPEALIRLLGELGC